MSLRGHPVEQEATLPDGRRLLVRVGVPEDGYIRRRELRAVSVDLLEGRRVVATVNSLLEPWQRRQALDLAGEIVRGLESGELEPTAGSIESLADQLR